MGMQTKVLGSLALAAVVSGCAVGAQPGEVESEVSAVEREQLRSLGVEALRPDGEVVRLVGAGGEDVGVVRIGAAGYEVELNAYPASLSHGDGVVRWSCSDGHAASAPDGGEGLLQWLGSDPEMGDGPCAASLYAGWIVTGVFRAPPEGCRRALVGDEARLVCEGSPAAATDDADADVRGAQAALLSSCGSGSFDGCVDTGMGCDASCWDCTSGWCTGGDEDSGGGGGGGGGDGGSYCYVTLHSCYPMYCTGTSGCTPTQRQIECQALVNQTCGGRSCGPWYYLSYNMCGDTYARECTDGSSRWQETELRCRSDWEEYGCEEVCP